MPKKLPKHHPGQIRKTVSLSFSAPLELEQAMNRAATRRGMNRSAYICWLVVNYLYIERGLLPPAPMAEELPQLPQIPTRIRRKPKS